MSDLDPLIHAPKRLRIMAILSAFDHVTFARLQDRLELTAPDLSKQLKTLQEAGHVRTSKTGRGPGSETWATMTRSGRRAYERHVAALRELLDGSGSHGDPGSDLGDGLDDGRAPTDGASDGAADLDDGGRVREQDGAA